MGVLVVPRVSLAAGLRGYHEQHEIDTHTSLIYLCVKLCRYLRRFLAEVIPLGSVENLRGHILDAVVSKPSSFEP